MIGAEEACRVKRLEGADLTSALDCLADGDKLEIVVAVGGG